MTNANDEASTANAQSGTPQTNSSLPVSSVTSTSDPRTFDLRFPTPLEALASDAPLRVLMSLRDNPNLALATDEELEQIAMKLRMVASTPQTQESMRRKEAGEKAPARKRKVDPLVAAKLASAQNAD